MPEFIEHCPECNSDDIATLRKRKVNRCEECGYEWEDVHYTDAAKPDVEEFCKNLAASADWVEKVRDGSGLNRLIMLFLYNSFFDNSID